MRMHHAMMTGAIAALLPVSAAGQNFTSTHTDCSGLQLYAAKGVPNGATHGYRFRGICRELEMDDGKVLRVRWEGWVEVESIYDLKTASLSENVTVKISGPSSGASSGTITLVLKCAQDPMVTGSPCTVQQKASTTAWPDFAKAWSSGKPFTAGKVTLQLATSLSSSSGNPPPPPPPPPPAPKSSTPTLLGVGKLFANADSNAVASRNGPAPVARAPNRAVRPSTSEIPLRSGARVALGDGRSITAMLHEGALRWSIIDANAAVLRIFPAGSRVLRSGSEIHVDWGGGVYNAGPEQPRRLTLPRRGGQ